MNRMYVAMLILIVMAVALGPVCMQAQTQRPRQGPDVRPGINLRRPDLVITSFVATGPALIVNGAVELPVKVIVKNHGNGAAAAFKVAVEYTQAGGGGPFAVAFNVAGEASNWYPSTDAALAAGKTASFSGRLKFNPATRGERVSLRAIADSCSGDEFMEDYCRVREINELNNKSAALWAALP
jgi:hypothetical protein